MTHMEVAGGYVKQIWLVLGWAKGWQFKTIVVVDGCLLSLSLCRRGFQYLLKVRPSSHLCFSLMLIREMLLKRKLDEPYDYISPT
jgi:hypothetical protein